VILAPLPCVEARSIRILSIVTEEAPKVVEGAARGVQINEPQVIFLEHEALLTLSVGDDESYVVLPHLTELLHGVTGHPPDRIGQKNVILDDSPEDAEMR